jgi:hypothetical protein
MMGRRRRDQGKLFYEFRLEVRLPEDHLLRRMSVFVAVALADLHKELEPYYSDIENAVIVDVEATPARTYDEVEVTKTMLDRTEACFV